MKKEDKEKLLKSALKILFWIFLVSFTVLYITQKTGYYEYELHNKVVLTDEKIKQFEKDVADGKNLSIENYLEVKDHNYQNKISKAGNYISKTLGNYVKTGIVETFKLLNKLIDE